ncbi:MAG: histidine--tRNA ligase [Spirochaetaceae bacterium]|jgi:histidyl-tRNA synthetase|nr:histidine--tRNA ligase [Spirochaetaceae bacterium]
MTGIIEPRILKGFRDFPPEAEITRRSLVERIEASFRLYGFVPIDTPALEYAEILLGKGGGETEKQVYRFTDQGGRDVALRFDLTVPFARFLAAHRNELSFPFKRYHIAKVWRGENTQRGRYREFTQCDFDIVGSGGAASDFEILLMMKTTLAAIGAGDCTIHVNHRGIFNRFLSRLGAAGQATDILRIVDKIAKTGREEAALQLAGVLDEKKAGAVLDYIEPRANFEETLAHITEASGGDTPESRHMERIWRYMNDAGIASSFILDPSITRGLDYYTGIVYESFLAALPSIGSVCSGGRYDNLAGLYSKEAIGGVGASIGLDRLISAMESLGVSGRSGSYAKLAIACVDEEAGGACQKLAGYFREKGIACEVMLEAKKLGQQFMLAEKKGLAWVIIPGEKPLSSPLSLRNLASRETKENLSLDQAILELSGTSGFRTEDA